ncbi:hypothetical protein [Leptospirillum ferrooxidans]|jgi:hypothetical protein|uniref:Uncharacterized protein n=1 Tax=Leptospirillum ferrooxidans (strain C2-3) TaxID=1162668 RepID=I0IR56_LEPFC|nr:hypothetical protein [Leptospirillum ferrooxidans]BAM07755.1 hypothetical protein LFE_2082 [Leptospirillum ferrooxidans C2-3]
MAEFGVNSVSNLDNPVPGVRETDYARQTKEADQERRREETVTPPPRESPGSFPQKTLGGRLDIHV